MMILLHADSVPPETPLDRRFGLAVRADYAGVELPISTSGPLHFNSVQEDYLAAAKLAARAGTNVPVVVMGAGAEPCLASPDSDARRLSEQRIQAALDNASWLGARVVVLPVGIIVGEVSAHVGACYEETRRLAMEAFLQLRFDAQRRALRLAIPCGGRDFLPSPVETRGFIDRINSPWVGVWLDIGGSFPAEKAAAWVRSLGWRVFHLRLTEGAPPAQGAATLPPGVGQNAYWPEIRAALGEMRYEGFYARANTTLL